MDTSTYPLAGARASTMAGQIDAVALFVTLVAAFFSLGIFVAVIILADRYRRGNRVDRSNAPTHSVPIEIAWTVIPLMIALTIFGWAAMLFFRQVQIPDGAMEIYVVGKQWMWKIQHPEGRWEMNELHVPVGKPVVLTMTSEDVIHSFYVPAFRLKQDVIPGQFTRLSFTATRPGVYHLFCAEFCGTYHSTMVGTVTVLPPDEYTEWLASGTVQRTMAQTGAELFRQYGCSGCHAGNSSVKAPPLEGIFGEPVPVQEPDGRKLEEIPARMIIADTKYIHDSIVQPEKLIAAGYRNIMPSFRNRLTEEQIFALVHYIKSLGDKRPPARGSRGGNVSTLTPEDYKARTGFIPDNVNQLSTGEPGRPTPGNRPGSGGSGGGAAPAESGGAGSEGTGTAAPAGGTGH